MNKTKFAIAEIIGKDGVADETGFSGGMFNFLEFIDVFLDLVLNDAMFAFYSLFFVFIYLWYHLSSLFLSCNGILLIVFSFPMTACISNGLLGVNYFGFLHVLIIFIVLGIAADDIFVFYDGWR
jgi:protein dispatched 1